MISTVAISLGLVAGILTSLGIIWVKGVKPVVIGVRKIGAVFDKVMEYDERISEIEQRTRQLTNNGGSHMKDAVERIERKLDSELVNIYKGLSSCPYKHNIELEIR